LTEINEIVAPHFQVRTYSHRKIHNMLIIKNVSGDTKKHIISAHYAATE